MPESKIRSSALLLLAAHLLTDFNDAAAAKLLTLLNVTPPADDAMDDVVEWYAMLRMWLAGEPELSL